MMIDEVRMGFLAYARNDVIPTERSDEESACHHILRGLMETLSSQRMLGSRVANSNEDEFIGQSTTKAIYCGRGGRRLSQSGQDGNIAATTVTFGSPYFLSILSWKILDVH